MNKEQIETKLTLLPLLTSVVTGYGVDQDDNPVIELSYSTIPGPGEVFLQVPIAPSETNLKDIVANLPLAANDRLASLAIMLTPPLPT